MNGIPRKALLHAAFEPDITGAIVAGHIAARGPSTLLVMHNSKPLWLLPPVCGIVSAVFSYGLCFISAAVFNASDSNAIYEKAFGWVFGAGDALDLGPHGCAGMVWIAIAPGVAGFLLGSVLGSIWSIKILIRRRRSGYQTPRIAARDIKACPEYGCFIEEDPERRYLYCEDLPLEFEKWLQRRRTSETQCEQPTNGKTPEAIQTPH